MHCLSEAEVGKFVQGALSPAEQAAAERHAAECAPCAAKVRAAEASRKKAAHQLATQVEVTSAVEAASVGSGSQDSHWTDNNLPIESSASGSASAPSVSLNDFLLGLSQSGLLPADEVSSVRQQTNENPSFSTVSGLVEWLVGQHKLTPYQADLLARGQREGLVLGNYVILDKVGQGGMGTVFKARHRRMNRLVAIKVLPQALSNVAEAIARFQREVEAAARLQHPHIAAAYDADEASGVHFLVMEFVDGPNLASYVKQRGPLPVGLAVRLMSQTARGLAAAHAQGVVHRDIKPGNLMVNRQGVLKILDMGLAQMRGQETNLDLTSDVTQTGRVMGTVDYMAPEQARDAKTVDLRADIYSLGCTLYYLLTGRSPAPAGSAAEKLLWHQTQNLPPLSTQVPQSTPRLDALFAKLMAKKPADRHTSMHAVVEELEQCLRELPVVEPGLLFDHVDHHGETLAGSGYGQPTMAGRGGDTVVSAAERRSPLFKSGRPDRTRAAWYAGLLGGAALLIGLALAGIWWRQSLVATAGPKAAMLLVTVDEGPAAVLVNGEKRGNAGLPADNPLAVQVQPGKVLLQVKREGFEPFEEQIEVTKQEPARIAVTLKPVEPLPKPASVPAPHKPYEKLLAWVFRNGGQVTAVTGGGEPRRLSSAANLPAQPLEILAIKLDGTGVSDDDLALLSEAPGLRELSLANTHISDAGVARLAQLTRLAALNLSRTSVTNASGNHLARLTDLVELNLERTAFADAGLSRIASLPRLERLFLSDTAVTDSGFELLQRMKTLSLLTAHGTELSEAGHAALRTALPSVDIGWDGADVERSIAMKLLERGATLGVVDRSGQRHDGVKGAENLPPGRIVIREVNLSTGGNFVDGDLKQLSLLPDIQSLILTGTRIAGPGLAHLHGLKTLAKVDLGALSISPTAVEQLRKSLPGCQVLVRDQVDSEVARQMLAAGGRLDVLTERNEQLADIDVTARLPAGKFFVRTIRFDDAANIDDAALQKIGDLQYLDSLFLSNAAITDAGVERIAACKSLRELNLSGTKVSSAGIVPLATLPKLARLYLARTTIGSDGLRQIGNLAALTHLSLRGVTLADDDLAPLKRLERLEWLELSGTPLGDSCLDHLQKLTRLRELNVAGTALSDAAREELAVDLGPKCRLIGDAFDPQRQAARWLFEHDATVALEGGRLASSQDLPRGACRVLAIDLAQVPRLKRDELRAHLAACTDVVSLNLSETPLLEQDLAFLDAMPKLRELRLARLTTSDRALAHLQGHADLQVLDLSQTNVTGQGLKHLAAARGLKQLLLSNSKIDDVHLTSLEQFPQLEALDISTVTNVTDAALPSIVALANLKMLGLRKAKLTDDALEQLAKLTELERLELEGVKIGDAGVANLVGLKKLRHLGLGGTSVTDGAVSTLRQMTNLRNLILTRTTVSADSIRQLQSDLKDCYIIGSQAIPRDPMAPGNFVPGAAVPAGSFEGEAGSEQ